jgi:Tfp pilus assembly protein PilO
VKFVDIFKNISTGRALLIGLIAVCFYYFFIFDKGTNQKSQIAATQQQIQTYQQQIDESQRKLDAAMVYKKTAAEVGSTVNKLLSTIPEKFGMPDLMRIVSNEVKVAGSSLVSIKPDKREISPLASEFEELSLSVDITGSFLQHMVFLSNLTKVNQILIIRNMSFSADQVTHRSETPVVKFTAEIVAYRYRGKQAAEVKEQ